MASLVSSARRASCHPLLLQSAFIGYRSVSSITKKQTDDSVLESRLDILALDDVVLEESLLSSEKLENIFSKIRRQNRLELNDLFPIHDPPSSMVPLSDTAIVDSQPASSLDAKSEVEDDGEDGMRERRSSEIVEEARESTISVSLMTESDILDTPSTAITRQLLPRQQNTADHFGVNLYHLLRYHPYGISEFDLRSQFQQHFGCDIPFRNSHLMMRHVIGKCSHLFVIRSDNLQYKWINNRNGLDEIKYLDLDSIPHSKLLQLLRRLLVSSSSSSSSSSNVNRLNPLHPHSSSLPSPSVSGYPLHSASHDHMLRLSDLQSEFERQFGGLFLCSDLYALIHRVGAIKKIASGTGCTYDFHLRWCHEDEVIGATSVVFKIWHILNKYPRGLQWHQLQLLYSSQYGEMLLLSENAVINTKYWSHFIAPIEVKKKKKREDGTQSKRRNDGDNDRVWKVADPALCEGRLLMAECKNAKKGLIHEMLNQCFTLTTAKQRAFVVHDIFALRGATAEEEIWKFVIVFTRQRHANHFYKEQRSRHSQHASGARVSRIDLLTLKRTLESMIPHPLPLSTHSSSSSSLSMKVAPPSRFASPLPFDIALKRDPMTIGKGKINGDRGDTLRVVHDDEEKEEEEEIEKEEDVLRRFVESKQMTKYDTMMVEHGTSSLKQTVNGNAKRRKTVNVQKIESLWGLLTHHVDGLTTEQMVTLLNQRLNGNGTHGLIQRRGDMLTADEVVEIMETQPSWFTKRKCPDAEYRWTHRPLKELMNQSVVLHPEKFILYEYLEEFMQSTFGGDIESTSRFRSNLVVHFRNEVVTENAFKSIMSEELRCRNIAIEVDHFCPSYSYDLVVPIQHRPLRFDSRFSQLLTAHLAEHSTVGSAALLEIMQKEGALHRRIESKDQFARLLLDAYSPYVHGQRSKDGADWLFASHRQYPRRMPLSLQNQEISRNAKHKRYYNDILHFFKEYEDGITLSRFLTEFMAQNEYLPAVPSLTEFMKSADIHAFYRKDCGDDVDLYLLPLGDKAIGGGGYRFPAEGITLEGFPSDTNTESLAGVMKDNIGDCFVLRRGIDRFVVWFADEMTAQQARKSFASPEVRQEGLQIVNVPRLCDRVCSWVNSQSVYF